MRTSGLLILLCGAWGFTLPSRPSFTSRLSRLQDSETSDFTSALPHASLSTPTHKPVKSSGLLPHAPPIPYTMRTSQAMSDLTHYLDLLRAPYDAETKTFLQLQVYKYLLGMPDKNLMYSLLTSHLTELMPYVYTPTVGTACLRWGEVSNTLPIMGLYIKRGMSKDEIVEALNRFPKTKVICVTDGERILGLGDLGSNGMPIPIGKLALYSACGGIDPATTLPVVLDVGCNVDNVRTGPFYTGVQSKRDLPIAAYDQLVDDFITASKEVYGRSVLIQFEDFGNSNAFRLLEKYQQNTCCFNDDIQGTAAVCLAGIISSLRITGPRGGVSKLKDHTFLFQGAGEAGVGIAMLISKAIMMESGCTAEESVQNIWLLDSQGLVTNERDMKRLAHHKIPFAHDPPSSCELTPSTLEAAVKCIKPTAIIGVSAQPQTFTKPIIEQMCENSEAPLIFSLSNPTSKSECSAEQAYKWSDGKCVFASGSPFDPVTVHGVTFVPGQGNNAYVFPGIGLGALVAKATKITDEDMLAAAYSLAAQVDEDQLRQGCTYPELRNIRSVSAKIAVDVARGIAARGDGEVTGDIEGDVERWMWEPCNSICG